MTNAIRKACTKKEYYMSMENAEKAAAIYKEHMGTNLKAYKCRYCEGYHLTKGEVK